MTGKRLPLAIEKLMELAANDFLIQERLMKDPVEAAQHLEIELSDSEKGILSAMSPSEIVSHIFHIDPEQELKEFPDVLECSLGIRPDFPEEDEEENS